jgi:hypothetical protein
VESAFSGSQAAVSFYWAPVNLDDSGKATAKTATQNTTTIHFVTGPHTSEAKRFVLPITVTAPRNAALDLWSPLVEHVSPS